MKLCCFRKPSIRSERLVVLNDKECGDALNNLNDLSNPIVVQLRTGIENTVFLVLSDHMKLEKTTYTEDGKIDVEISITHGDKLVIEDLTLKDQAGIYDISKLLTE